MNIRQFTITNLLFATLFAATGHAEDGQKGQRDGRRGPPQVALDACVTKVARDACSFTGRNEEELSGICFAPAERDLACRPEGHDRRQGRRRAQDSAEGSG